MLKNPPRNAHYTMVWNVLDYASCVFPVTRVLPTVDVVRPATRDFLSAADKRHFESCKIQLVITGTCFV